MIGDTVPHVAVASRPTGRQTVAEVPSPTEVVDETGSAQVTAGGASVYRQHLEELAASYEVIRGVELGLLSKLVQAVRRRQCVYVGSGGALPVARLAADLHEAQAHSLARAATPLELIGMPPLDDPAVVLFTASGRHPDASAALAAAVRANVQPLVVVTQRARDDLPAPFSQECVEVVTLPAPTRKEGFLATGSVLTMTAAIVAASGWQLPIQLPHLEEDGIKALRRNTVILSAPGLGAVATDLETRLAETGLSTVQVTDYRNFAHGRHTGYARNLDETTVVALLSPAVAGLAEATLASLPQAADVVRLQSSLEWPLCVLDLLVGSMKLVAVTADQQHFDPSRPNVPAFGRRLYHLSTRRYLPAPRDAVDRKLSAAYLPRQQEMRRIFERSFEEWLAELRDAYFGGIVLDYDGTVCTTAGRYRLPDAPIRERLLELIEYGAVIGFASGRGSSLHRDLRAWVPQELWPRVELGLYNGGITTTLSEELGRSREPVGAIAEAAIRLGSTPLVDSILIEQREQQIALQSRSPSITREALRQLASEVLARPPALPLKVMASAHSIDIVPSESAKTRTLERVHARAVGDVIAIGDQGQTGGNDFDLLAATRRSLSVDRVSGDPTRCWNLDEGGERGPSLLARYLDALHPSRKGLVFRWK